MATFDYTNLGASLNAGVVDAARQAERDRALYDAQIAQQWSDQIRRNEYALAARREAEANRAVNFFNVFQAQKQQAAQEAQQDWFRKYNAEQLALQKTAEEARQREFGQKLAQDKELMTLRQGNDARDIFTTARLGGLIGRPADEIMEMFPGISERVANIALSLSGEVESEKKNAYRIALNAANAVNKFDALKEIETGLTDKDPQAIAIASGLYLDENPNERDAFGKLDLDQRYAKLTEWQKKIKGQEARFNTLKANTGLITQDQNGRYVPAIMRYPHWTGPEFEARGLPEPVPAPEAENSWWKWGKRILGVGSIGQGTAATPTPQAGPTTPAPFTFGVSTGPQPALPNYWGWQGGPSSMNLAPVPSRLKLVPQTNAWVWGQ